MLNFLVGFGVTICAIILSLILLFVVFLICKFTEWLHSKIRRWKWYKVLRAIGTFIKYIAFGIMCAGALLIIIVLCYCLGADILK